MIELFMLDVAFPPVFSVKITKIFGTAQVRCSCGWTRLYLNKQRHRVDPRSLAITSAKVAARIHLSQTHRVRSKSAITIQG